MNFLTLQEKCVLIFLSLIILTGSVANLILKQFPEIRDITNFIERSASIVKIDVNSASKDELINIPYIGEYTAKKIISYRQEFGNFSDLQELMNVKGIKARNYERFKQYLSVGD